MRAVMVMFDSLNRRFLPPYGSDFVHAPNFARLATRTVTFDTCYAGSMPCMPARREMHTGRYNFLHRSWGPLEPFDDSVPEMLKNAGVYTHLATDHQHYWEDGGATFHNRYSTYELFRGQEGDAWKGHVADPEIPDSIRQMRHRIWRQDWVNRQYLQDVADHPQTQVFDAGLHFLETNVGEDDWFLQIECFDPHEPFFSYAEHKKHYDRGYEGPHFDWPDYKRVEETPEEVEHARDEYAALLTMCDSSLGRVLDFMDDHAMWEDTVLIVCTDHGFLLGEHGWWGKNVQPWFDENIHTPLFVWSPDTTRAGERCDALVQTIDIPSTLLEVFGLEPTEWMQGFSLLETIRRQAPPREAGLFGTHGGHVNVTDGRYVYMRACATPGNEPLFEHTLMPTHMNSRFTPQELRGAELVAPFSFTQEVPLLRVPGSAIGNPYTFGSLLYDLESDPEQAHPLVDDALELRMVTLMVDLMHDNDAPPSQYLRLGLPETGAPDETHLLVRRQWDQVLSGQRPLPDPTDYRTEDPSVNSSLRSLMDDPSSRAVLEARLGPLVHHVLPMLAETPLIRLTSFFPPLADALPQLDRELSQL